MMSTSMRVSVTAMSVRQTVVNLLYSGALFMTSVAPAIAMSADWNRQEFAVDHFAIQLPIALTPSTSGIIGPSGQRLSETLYRAQEEGAAFEVAVIDLPDLSEDAALTWGAKVVTGDGEVRVAVSERIDRVFGRNLTIDRADGGRSMAAIFYVKDKLYLLQGKIAAAKVATMAGDALRFQQSLEFTGYGFEAGRPENRGTDGGRSRPGAPDPSQNGNRQRREPPPGAFADCKGKAQGDAVQHTTPRGLVAAHCVATPNGLAARPDRPFPGEPPGPPPDQAR